MTGTADTRAIQQFRSNIESVHELLRFDELVLQLAIGQLKRVSASHDAASITNPRHRVEKVISMLERIRDNQSLQPHYQQMYNQCVVLLVSYFGSAIRQLFVDAIASAVRFGNITELLDEELKLTPRVLVERQTDVPELVGESIADRKDLSFQDMQSIARAFSRYFHFEPEKNATVNDIILGQACRHAIVHAGAVVDIRIMSQLRGALPRTLKPQLVSGDQIQFSPDEINHLSKSMLMYLRGIAEMLGPDLLPPGSPVRR